MIRLQKKTETRKEREDENPTANMDSENGDIVTIPASHDCKDTGTITLLGIGGKQVTSGSKKMTKKRTPGELRIQKGLI